MTNSDPKRFATTAVQSGKMENSAHPHATPIFASSAFTFDSAEQGMRRFSGAEEGFTYSRFGNPTTKAAADAIAALEAHGLQDESGSPVLLKALLHASGQAAMSTLFLSNLSAGDTILASKSLYGGTHEFLTNLLPRFGVNTIFSDMKDMDKLNDTLRKDQTIRMLHLETPANPTMQCVDIAAVAEVAKQNGRKVSVDNTIATPFLQQPFKFGVDFVFHSTTKFLNGHGNAIGGVLVGNDSVLMNGPVYNTHKLLGGNSNPFDAFLLLQGLKTLPLRMKKHCSNAMKLAEFLSTHDKVAVVNYNGLPSHPDFIISTRQMHRPGAVFSFELKGGFDTAVKFINRLQVCVRAVSLGTADTLISHPASMSHSGMSPADRLKSGISDGLIRMSVGLEDCDDLINDLEEALKVER